MEMSFLSFAHYLAEHLDVVYTYLLMLARYLAFFLFVPGIGMGERGLAIRFPAVMVFALVSVLNGPYSRLPSDWFQLGLSLVVELMLGGALGLIPLMIVSGVQMGAQIASSSMGLGAAQLIDPTSGATVPDLARIMGDLTIVIFLLLGGHYVMIQGVAGLGGAVVPGSFSFSGLTMELLINRAADIFRVGIMISAPVIVALLLTQFVMGLISRAVPTVNIFIVSFPLTIGIGMILSMLAIPDLVVFLEREFSGLENSVVVLTESITTN